MPLTRIHRIASVSANSFGAGAYTPTGGTFTPFAGELMVATVSGGWSASSTWAPTISDTSSLVWTQLDTRTANAGGWTSGTRTFWAVGRGVSITVSVDHGADSIFSYDVTLEGFTGQTATSFLVGVTGSSTLATNGAVTLTNGVAPTVDDITVGVLHLDLNTGTSTVTEGASVSFLEVADVTVSAGSTGHVQARTNNTGTACTWDDTNTGAGDIFRVTGVTYIVKSQAPSQIVTRAPGIRARLLGPPLRRADSTVSSVAATNAPADVALVTATGLNASTSIAQVAGSAAATATGQNAAANVKVSAGVAQATATANGATISGSTTAGVATVTATGLNASESLLVPAGVAQATAAGLNAAVNIQAAAGVATATATANGATVNGSTTAGVATATATGQNAAVSLLVPAGSATATATAFNPTVTTTGATNAAAGVAQATATANGAAPTVSVSAGSAAATATGLGASISIRVSAGVAQATATALSASLLVAATASRAQVTATANGATIATSASAGIAQATATANGAVCSIKVTAGVATVTATAYDITMSTGVLIVTVGTTIRGRDPRAITGQDPTVIRGRDRRDLTAEDPTIIRGRGPQNVGGP